MSTQNARDTHFFLAGWNGHLENPNATTHFQQAMKSAPTPTTPLAAEPTPRSDAETMARAETAARFLLGWKYGQMPTNPDTPLRLSVHAKAQWAWNAACKLLRFIDGSAPDEVQAMTTEPMGPAAPAAQAVEPAAVALPWPRAEVDDLLARLVSSHISAFIAGERGSNKDEARAFIKSALVDAAAFIRSLLEDTDAAPAPAAVAVPDEREAFELDFAKVRAAESVSLDERLVKEWCLRVDSDGTYKDPHTRLAYAMWQARAALAATPPAQAQLSPVAAQVIENLLQLARVVDRAVQDWGESFADGSSVVKFHKEEADKMESILEFFDSLPDAPPEEGVTESGPLRAARALHAMAAPQAQDVQRDVREFPAMTHELASILGLMCFQCIPYAQALRAAGHPINTRAEDEQAAVLHWMLGHYFLHGDNWRAAAAADMERMKANWIAASAAQGE